MRISNLLNHFLRYFVAVIIVGFTFSCSKDKDSEEKKEQDIIYDLNLKSKVALTDSNMSSLKKSVFKALKDKKPIEKSDITKLLIEEQVNYYNEDDKSQYRTSIRRMTSWLNDIIVNTIDYDNIEDIKNAYQANIWNMDRMKYKKEAASLPYIMIEEQFSSFSSTLLHQLVLRDNANFKEMNSVVIYEWGHMLSGYMSKEGDFYRLIGIENTVTGKGIKEYKDLASYNGEWIRVADSELFAILEIFKNDISNADEVAKQILDLTAKKYNLDPKFNYGYNAIVAKSSYKSDESPLNFGNEKVELFSKDIKNKNEVLNDNINNSKDWSYDDIDAVEQKEEKIEEKEEEVVVDNTFSVETDVEWRDVDISYVPKRRLTDVEKVQELNIIKANPKAQDGKAVKVCVSFVKSKSDEDGHECDDALFNVFFNNETTPYLLNLNNETCRTVRTFSGKNIKVGNGSDVPGTIFDKATWQNGKLKIELKSGFGESTHRIHDGVATIAIIGKVRDSQNELRFFNLKSELSSLKSHGNYTVQEYNFDDFELENDIYDFDDYCNVIKVNN